MTDFIPTATVVWVSFATAFLAAVAHILAIGAEATADRRNRLLLTINVLGGGVSFVFAIAYLLLGAGSESEIVTLVIEPGVLDPLLFTILALYAGAQYRLEYYKEIVQILGDRLELIEQRRVQFEEIERKLTNGGA